MLSFSWFYCNLCFTVTWGGKPNLASSQYVEQESPGAVSHVTGSICKSCVFLSHNNVCFARARLRRTCYVCQKCKHSLNSSDDSKCDFRMTASDCYSWIHRHVRKRKRLVAHRSFFSFSRSSGLCLKHSHLEEVLVRDTAAPVNLPTCLAHQFGVPQCQDTLSAIIGFDQVVCALTPRGRGNGSRRLGLFHIYLLNFNWCGSTSKVFRLLCLISRIIQQLGTGLDRSSTRSTGPERYQASGGRPVIDWRDRSGSLWQGLFPCKTFEN